MGILKPVYQPGDIAGTPPAQTLLVEWARNHMDWSNANVDAQPEQNLAALTPFVQHLVDTFLQVWLRRVTRQAVLLLAVGAALVVMGCTVQGARDSTDNRLELEIGYAQGGSRSCPLGEQKCGWLPAERDPLGVFDRVEIRAVASIRELGEVQHGHSIVGLSDTG